ncbi:hypothetical protein ASE75_09235 [Sphingomonas sp. Leaf17]|nr:hypothetical protein ASE75_09235 [Sphingomonas sp. Leaf17]
MALVAGPAASDRLTHAVAAIGGRLTRYGWHDPIAADAHDVLALDLDGADHDIVTDLFARIVPPATPVVVAFDADWIDLAAGLMGPDVQLLCAPTRLDCLAALVIAAGQSDQPARVRSDDAARVAVLESEITRIAGLLQRLARDDAPKDHVASSAMGFAARPAETHVTADDIRAVIRARRLRERFFADGLLEDPAWDMLLDLFAAALEGRSVSVSSLCIAAAVAPTTALRWIGRMVDAGLFVRHADPQDRRRVFIALSPRADDAMHGYVAAVRSAGLSIA